jgi:hypothetical protein
MASYILYTTFILIVAFVRITDKYNGKYQGKLALLLFFMFVMASFRRYDVGNDTQSYLNFFKQMSYGNISYDSRIEIGYRYLNIFVSYFAENFTWILLLSSAFLFVVLYRFFKRYSDNLILCGVLFWLIGFITIVSATRQAIAIGFIYIAIYFLVKRIRIPFIAFVIVATLFHSPAIIFLILLPLLNIKLTIKSVTVITLSITMLTLSTGVFIKLIISFFDSYYANYIGTQSGILAVLFHSLIGLIFILIDELINKKRSREIYSKRIYNLAKWSTLAYSCFSIVSYNISIAGRVSYYFIPAMILYISFVCKNNKIVTAVFIMVLILYNILAIWLRPEWNSFFPFYYNW